MRTEALLEILGSHSVGLSKNLHAVRVLARDMLARAPGERLPTAAQYQQLTGVGSGTVQKALRTLQRIGAVKLRPRGQAGTFVVDMALQQLWPLAGNGPPTAVLPLASSAELMGLATALRQEFKRLQMPLQAFYTYGSDRRRALIEEDEADFTVVSAAAAKNLCQNSTHWTRFSLSPTEYYYENSWVVLVRRDLDLCSRNSLRTIGIDLSSYDHTTITKAEFPSGHGYEYVEGHFPFMTEELANGKIDALAWHKSTLAIPLAAAGIQTRPLQRSEARQAATQMGTAQFIVHSTRTELMRVFQLLDTQAMADLQSKVLAQEVLPLY